MEMPEWIRNPREFDIRNILQDSLCYLACGLHGHFVKYYMGNAYSFVYIDYHISRERLLQDMDEYGFTGYRVIRQESINPHKLHPGGWDALTWYYRPRRERRFDHFRNDPNGNCFGRNREPMNTLWKKVLPVYEDGDPNEWLDNLEEPFAEWFIFERTEEYDETHNPKRFSFLFICTEAVAAYQALYLKNRMAPKILAIPHYGLGMNWTNFSTRERILARTIFYPNNPVPEYLVGMSGFCEPWPEYSNRLKIYPSYYNGDIKIWKFSGVPARLNPPVTEQMKTDIDRPSENELVFVEGGEFQMGDARMTGSEDERPAHRVRLTYDFYIGKYTVTCQEYSRFCRETGVEEPEDEYFPRMRKPVVYLNWFAAIAYCNWFSEKEGLPQAYDRFGNLLDFDGSPTSDLRRVAGYRLPTEAEWEYAARGGNKSRDYIFAGSNDFDEVAWFRGDFFERPREVGLKSPNELGLYDMSGNVWELCSDNSERYSEGLEINPYGETGVFKSLRGGSVRENPTAVAVTTRDGAWGGYIDFAVGFRIAKTAQTDRNSEY